MKGQTAAQLAPPSFTEVMQTKKALLSTCYSPRVLIQACTTGLEAQRHSIAKIQARIVGSHNFHMDKNGISGERGNFLPSHLLLLCKAAFGME